MSGKKRILVDEGEWFRAQRAAQKLKDVRRDVPRLLNEVRDQTRAEHERTRTEFEERARRAERTLQTLGEQTRELERGTERRLREQSERLHRELRGTAERIEQDTRTRLAEQREALRRELAEERRQRTRDLAALSGRVDEMAVSRERAEAAARGWLADGDTMAELIDSTLPHQRHTPGRLDRLRVRLDSARGTITSGHYEAALAVAQDAYFELSELRLEIEHHELERRLAQEASTDALVLVETLIAENTVRPVTGPDGQPLPGIQLDVDHWSEGELSALREEVADRLSRARDEATDTAEQHELSAGAAELEQHLGDIVERAGMRQLASQLRVNLADSVAQTLYDIGAYELADGEYRDSDERRSYHARLEHANGNKIVVEILPAPDGETSQVLRVLSFDHDTASESELRGRAEAVQLALTAGGHQTSRPVSEPGVPEPEALDLARHRQSAEPLRKPAAEDGAA
jgi:hypothetical protein